MNLTIELKADDIRDGIVKALHRGPGIMGQNPLMQALGKAMQENEARLEAWAREQLATVMGDQQFRSDFRRELKQAMLAEAQNMGRKAARAAVNAAEVTK